MKLAYKDAGVGTAGGRTVQGMITTEHIDSDREVILADGVRFRDHVPLLAGHNANDPAQCIGKMRRSPERRNNGWFASFMVHEQHEDLWAKARDGLLQFSIGFDRIAHGHPTAEELEKWPGVECVTRQCLVVETSLVAVPANAHAILQEAKAHKMLAKVAGWLTSKTEREVITLDVPKSIELVDTAKVLELN